MYGFLRIDVEEHTMVESHPNTRIDLRLDQPWDELVEHYLKYDFSSTDTQFLTHIPFPILLLRAVSDWKNKVSENINQYDHFPPTREEKPKFIQILRSLTQNAYDDENVQEATAHCLRLFNGTKLPAEIKKILDQPKASAIDKNSSTFWILVNATKRFVENEGKGSLPLSGVVPDMKSDTDSYVQLQHM